MEQVSRTHNRKLYDQIEEAFGKVVYSYTTQIVHAANIHKRNTFFKWSQIILSAISAGGFITTLVTNHMVLSVVGAISSTILLVLTAYFKETSFSTEYIKHLEASNKLWLIREKYLSLLTDFETLSTDEITVRRDNLQSELSEVYNDAPITSKKSYRMAQKSLKENESQFFHREELNKMLPEHLRRK